MGVDPEPNPRYIVRLVWVWLFGLSASSAPGADQCSFKAGCWKMNLESLLVRFEFVEFCR